MSRQPIRDVRQKVLVVDDDQTMRELLTDYLEQVGFEVRTASDGRAGLHALGEGPVDLILTDYRMPIMTGLDMAASIRMADPVTPIILMTGDASTLDPAAVAKAGITRMLPKPFNMHDLLSGCVPAAL